MILRNPREPLYGQPVENAFVAADKRTGEQLGLCVLFDESNPVLFPRRPVQIRLQFEGDGAVLSQVLGAAIARARELAAQSGQPARIYTECPPEDQRLLDALRPYGFSDSDGLVRMSVKLPAAAETRLPTGCVIVEDDLSDPLERKYFLDRYNALFGTDGAQDWLKEIASRRNFGRILGVSPVGLAGEVLLHTQDGAGRIDYLQTARRWRNMGVASHLLRLVCERFQKLGVYTVEADIRVRIPHLLHTMEGAGFSQSRLLMRYPGIDLNP